MPSESDKWGWNHVTVFGRFDKGSGAKRWKCNHCNLRYNGSYSRVRAHLLGSPPSKRIRTSRPSLTCAAKEDIDEKVARFFYVHGLNLNVVNSPYFHDMAKAISTFGPGYEPLSVDELSDSFPSREKGRIERSLALVTESWPHTGSSILCFGLMFLKAVDIDDVDGAENVFAGVLDDTVMEFGPKNVFQIISHLGNASKLSDSDVLSKFPQIFFVSVYFTLYMHGSVDPLSVKFAPSLCIVQRIFELKQQLQELVVSEGWKQWKVSESDNILSIEAAILGDDFWSSAHLLLQVYQPFALEAIKCKDIDYGIQNQLEELIENRWDALFSPLHAAGYILNPRHFGKGQTKDKIVMRGWKAALERDEPESANRGQVSTIAMCQKIWQEYEFPGHETSNRWRVDRVEDLVFVRNNLRLHSQRNISNSLSG
ncbi:hypothetical protein D8674_006305 [Pyrus ussuriensis x Pyrus communis]|uniref:BED-type domain-containing protein n=1 Tax=Pyrus ussuriensis x Pyrus communis TaxID=2448454 RepID=A0A5N5FTX1_9ROSA|nr:hypothetical protein D8674_006305 [Pyrus ussuriensis x Pyrus communis]